MFKSTRVVTGAVLVLAAFVLAGCGGTDRRRPVNPATTAASTARFIELRADTSAGTIHFLRGLYSLESEDQRGFYYRAPVKVYERSFAGRVAHDGGIFVSRRNPQKLRGYVIMPYGVTQVGNLSGADYQFRY
ncbi:MAG TPA: hypothetical protein VH188_14525 [Chthoniobacterales bacterium]|nr:hypothetical protein [Chthoniobacterales bacterium]